MSKSHLQKRELLILVDYGSLRIGAIILQSCTISETAHHTYMVWQPWGTVRDFPLLFISRFPCSAAGCSPARSCAGGSVWLLFLTLSIISCQGKKKPRCGDVRVSDVTNLELISRCNRAKTSLIVWESASSPPSHLAASCGTRTHCFIVSSGASSSAQPGEGEAARRLGRLAETPTLKEGQTDGQRK